MPLSTRPSGRAVRATSTGATDVFSARLLVAAHFCRAGCISPLRRRAVTCAAMRRHNPHLDRQRERCHSDVTMQLESHIQAMQEELAGAAALGDEATAEAARRMGQMLCSRRSISICSTSSARPLSRSAASSSRGVSKFVLPDATRSSSSSTTSLRMQGRLAVGEEFSGRDLAPAAGVAEGCHRGSGGPRRSLDQRVARAHDRAHARAAPVKEKPPSHAGLCPGLRGEDDASDRTSIRLRTSSMQATASAPTGRTDVRDARAACLEARQELGERNACLETPGGVSLQIKLPSGRVVVTTADQPRTTVEVVALGPRGQDAVDEIEVAMDEPQGRHVVRIEQRDKFRCSPIQISRGGDFECRITCPVGTDPISPEARPIFAPKGSSARSPYARPRAHRLDSARGESR